MADDLLRIEYENNPKIQQIDLLDFLDGVDVGYVNETAPGGPNPIDSYPITLGLPLIEDGKEQFSVSEARALAVALNKIADQVEGRA